MPHEPGDSNPLAKPVQQGLAWAVHAYTALGLVASAGVAYVASQTPLTSDAIRTAFWLLFLATLIDATDGTLARKVRVKEVLPGFDGRRLDDLVDWLNYTCLPLYLMWRAQVLPMEQSSWLLFPLLASAYGFCQTGIKTADGFFLGFPSYWNVVAFYLILLRPPVWCSLGLLLGLSVLTFVPTTYFYPSQRGTWNRLSLGLGVVWTALVVYVLIDWPLPSGLVISPNQTSTGYWMALLSMAYPVYYLVASWLVSAWSVHQASLTRQNQLAGMDDSREDSLDK